MRCALCTARGGFAREASMQSRLATFVAAIAVAGAATVLAGSQDKPKVEVAIPNPGVPEIMTIEGKFVRAAYNNEGYVIIGYQVSNRSIGDEWMMIDMGSSLLNNTPEYELT